MARSRYGEGSVRPPIESIEVYLDDAAEQLVRSMWSRLADKQVSSLAHGQHTPHITIVAAPHTGGVMRDVCTTASTWADQLLGTQLVLPGIAVFPGARHVMYASVTPTMGLLRGHAGCYEQLRQAQITMFDTSAPDRWTPHCTLAKRLRQEDVATAMQVLSDDAWPMTAQITRVIHWDGAAREVTVLSELR